MSHSQEPVREHDARANGYDGSGWYPGAGGEPARAPRRPWRRTAAVAALTLLAIAAAGVPLGLLWSWASPSVPVVETANGAVVGDPSPEQFIAADGWFTIFGFIFGLLAALAAWFIVRRHRGPVLLSGIVLGALCAALVAWQVGRRPGLTDWQRWQDTAVAGDTFNRPPDLSAYGALLVPAFAAVIVCTLLAGWSNDPDLDVPGATPGYGRDLRTGDHLAGHHRYIPEAPGRPPAGGDQPGYPPAGYGQSGPGRTRNDAGSDQAWNGADGDGRAGYDPGRNDQVGPDPGRRD